MLLGNVDTTTATVLWPGNVQFQKFVEDWHRRHSHNNSHDNSKSISTCERSNPPPTAAAAAAAAAADTRMVASSRNCDDSKCEGVCNDDVPEAAHIIYRNVRNRGGRFLYCHLRSNNDDNVPDNGGAELFLDLEGKAGSGGENESPIYIPDDDDPKVQYRFQICNETQSLRFIERHLVARTDRVITQRVSRTSSVHHQLLRTLYGTSERSTCTCTSLTYHDTGNNDTHHCKGSSHHDRDTADSSAADGVVRHTTSDRGGRRRRPSWDGRQRVTPSPIPHFHCNADGTMGLGEDNDADVDPMDGTTAYHPSSVPAPPTTAASAAAAAAAAAAATAAATAKGRTSSRTSANQPNATTAYPYAYPAPYYAPYPYPTNTTAPAPPSQAATKAPPPPPPTGNGGAYPPPHYYYYPYPYPTPNAYPHYPHHHHHQQQHPYYHNYPYHHPPSSQATAGTGAGATEASSSSSFHTYDPRYPPPAPDQRSSPAPSPTLDGTGTESLSEYDHDHDDHNHNDENHDHDDLRPSPSPTGGGYDFDDSTNADTSRERRTDASKKRRSSTGSASAGSIATPTKSQSSKKPKRLGPTRSQLTLAAELRREREAAQAGQHKLAVPEHPPGHLDDDHHLLQLPRGVTVRPSGKWQAQIYFCGQSRYIGVYETSRKAAAAFDVAVRLLRQQNLRFLPNRAEEANDFFTKVRIAANAAAYEPPEVAASALAKAVAALKSIAASCETSPPWSKKKASRSDDFL